MYMDITTLFAQVFGIYLILTGVMVLIRQEHMVSIGRMFGKDQALRLSMGALVTLAGLFMVLTYRDWSTVASSIITLVGWLILIKGIVLFGANDKQINAVMGSYVKGHYYTTWGVVALAAGVYLALLGFGLM
jgi:glucose uptake protein GlcU